MTSLRQLARLIGVDEKSVRKAEKAGVFKGSLRRGDDGALLFLDVAAAVDLWERSGRRLRGSSSAAKDASSVPPAAASAVTPAQASFSAPLLSETDGVFVPDGEQDGVPPPPTVDAPPSLVEAQIATQQERARKLRMENDLAEGGLVEAVQAGRLAFEFARTLRENVLNIPARLAAELAAERDEAVVYRRLDGALREALVATAEARFGEDDNDGARRVGQRNDRGSDVAGGVQPRDEGTGTADFPIGPDDRRPEVEPEGRA